jgi:hypothetical protein
MKTPGKARAALRISATGRSRAERVGTAEFRGNLAKYLRQAESGHPVVIQGRGRSTYVLRKLEEDEVAASVFGCMRERTLYAAGAVVSATEEWTPGPLP